ncbi:MAG: PEGA domain-containing protein [Deltaproteobacteria bacterium]|nr:PEGA domain-containing protein [Deltaproteobacteria bacterium]
MNKSCILGLLLVASSSFAAPDGKTRVAVLAVPGEDPAALALATKLRSLLVADDVVDAAALGRRLQGPVGVPVDIAMLKGLAAAAEEAFNALDHERSVALLEDAITQLEGGSDLSVEKAALLEQSRLTCAQRLLGLAGPSETGNGETKNGTRARAHLAKVLKANPGFVLDASRYPPKLHALLAKAAADVKAAGQGGLAVRSSPSGATVFLEGRALGVTPLSLAGAVPVGRHRLWLDLGGRRSITRVVDVEAGVPLPVEIDVGFEGSLVPAGPGITPVVPFSTGAWKRLAGFVDVDVVVAVGSSEGRVWGVSAEAAGVVRQGSVEVGQEEALASFLRGGAGGGVDVVGVPASVFVPEVAAVEPAGEFPWTAVGIGAAVGAVVVAGALTGVVLYATRQVDTRIGVSFGDPP